MNTPYAFFFIIYTIYSLQIVPHGQSDTSGGRVPHGLSRHWCPHSTHRKNRVAGSSADRVWTS